MTAQTPQKRKFGCIAYGLLICAIFILYRLISSDLGLDAISDGKGKPCKMAMLTSISGNDRKTTDIIDIKGQKWKVVYSFKALHKWVSSQRGTFFQIYIHDKSGVPLKVAANVTNKMDGSDEFIVHEPGEFYLEILSHNLYYNVDIVECR